MRINKDNHYEDNPVCRFGPGGDFIWHWPGEELSFTTEPVQNKLTEVLARLREIILGGICSENCKDLTSADLRSMLQSDQEQEIGYGIKGKSKPEQSDAAAGAVAQGNIGISSGQLLFSDDWGAGRKAGHKPKHRLRAHRRAAKKRVSFELLGQGTLFRADLQGTASA